MEDEVLMNYNLLNNATFYININVPLKTANIFHVQKTLKSIDTNTSKSNSFDSQKHNPLVS